MPGVGSLYWQMVVPLWVLVTAIAVVMAVPWTILRMECGEKVPETSPSTTPVKPHPPSSMDLCETHCGLNTDGATQVASLRIAGAERAAMREEDIRRESQTLVDDQEAKCDHSEPSSYSVHGCRCCWVVVALCSGLYLIAAVVTVAIGFPNQSDAIQMRAEMST